MPCVYAPRARSRAVVFGSALLAMSALAWTSLRADTPAPEPPAVAPKPEQIIAVASTRELELTSGASLCVSGRVRIGREPVPGASLTVSYGGRHPGDHARTDEAGHFQLDCWPGLKNRILVGRVGKQQDLDLREPGPSTWLEIDLPGGRVEGRVLTAQGAPIPGIEVSVYSESSADLVLEEGGMIRGVVRDQRGRPAALSKVRTLDRRHAALTDRCGQYELGPLPLGPVHVEAVDDHEIGRTTAPLTVTSGEIARAEIGLSTGSELRILAVGPGGSPVLPRRFSIVDAHGDTPSGHAYLLRTDKVPSEPIQSWDELLYELSEAGDRPYFSIRPRSGVIGVFPLLPGTYTIRAVMNDDGPSITRVVEVGSEPLYEVRLD